MRSQQLPSGVIAVACEGYSEAKALTRNTAILAPAADSGLPIASLTKPVMAAAVRRLEMRGLLDTRESAARYLPVLADAQDPRLTAVTIEQLLNHSAGLPPADFNDPVFNATELAHIGRRVRGCEAGIARSLATESRFEPGSRADYSNVGYCLLGELVESVTGAPLPRALSDELRLGNELQWQGWADSRPASGAVEPLSSRGTVPALTPDELALLGAAGGAVVAAGTLAQLLHEETDRDWVLRKVSRGEDGLRYGLGWSLWQREDGLWLSHIGDTPGVFAMALMSPDSTVAVAVFTARVTDALAAAWHLAPLLVGRVQGIEQAGLCRGATAPASTDASH